MSIKNTRYLACSVMRVWARWGIGVIKDSSFKGAKPQDNNAATRFYNLNFFFIDYIYVMVVLGGELAVPYSRNPLYAGLNSL
jgi:hypothetical protein